jgi:RecA/RadA recombinase
MIEKLKVRDITEEAQSTNKSKVEFFSSGSTLLDLALGGGWALGRIFNIVGDKSTGKCVRNSYIIDESGIELIDDVGKSFEHGTIPWIQDLALDTSKISSCTCFYKEKVSTTLKVTTRHGYSLEGTPQHPILCFTPSCEFVFKKLEEVQVGDYTIISKKADLIQRDPPNLCSLPERGPHDYHTQYCKVPETVNLELARILGLFVADGNFAGSTLSLTNDASWFRSLLVKNCEECFGVTPTETFDSESNTNTYAISRIQLCKWLDCILEGKSKNFTGRTKFIPKIILQSPQEFQIEFLKSLIDCDSWFDIKGSMIQYCTASEVLATQVHLLLLNLGIVSTKSFEDQVKKYEGHKYWSICISGKQLKRYLEVVGTNREESPTPGDKDRSDYDSIPFIKQRILDDISKARSQTGWNKNGKTRRGRFPVFQINTEAISFCFLENQFIKKFSSSAFSEFFDWNFYNFIASCEYHFDPIISTEVINHVEQVNVHDVFIPKNHQFWCNGFISHNTGLAIEAFANFKLAFPKGRMRYAEAEAAFDDVFAEQLGFPKEVERSDLLNTVEEFTQDLYKFSEEGGPSLYILDSLDALSDDAELERFKRRLEGKEEGGSYGTQKAKEMSQMFRLLVKDMGERDCTLGIVSQTRDNIGVTFGASSIRSGGRALDFYASHCLWLHQRGRVDKLIKGESRPYGVSIQSKVEKNKVAAPFRLASYDILFGYGIDDENSMIDWLEKQEVLKKIPEKKEGKVVVSKEVDEADEKRKLLEKLRKENNREELRKLSQTLKEMTTQRWNDMEEKAMLKIRKYAR